MARETILRMVLVTVIAYSIMLVFWPYAASKPFKNPFNALTYLSNIRPIASSAGYIPYYLLIKLPELTQARWGSVRA
jgi:hypothetical protein